MSGSGLRIFVLIITQSGFSNAILSIGALSSNRAKSSASSCSCRLFGCFWGVVCVDLLVNVYLPGDKTKQHSLTARYVHGGCAIIKSQPS